MTVITSPALRARWQALAPREQTLVLAAGGLVAFALLWWLAVAPALSTLRAAPARHAELDSQLQRMQGLRAEAQQLQSAPRNTRGDSVGALRTALTQRLGNTAQLNVVGDRATVTLKGAPADALLEASNVVQLEAKVRRWQWLAGLSSVAAAVALAWLAWAGASGGAHGRRRGNALGRDAAWWTAASLTGQTSHWPLSNDAFETVANSLQWFWWDVNEPTTGWQLQLCIHHADRNRSWAISVHDWK